MTKLEISVKTRALRHELNRVSTFKVNRFAQVCTVQANEETHVFKKTRDLRQSLISVACARTMLSQIYFRNLANTLTSPVSLPLVFLAVLQVSDPLHDTERNDFLSIICGEYNGRQFFFFPLLLNQRLLVTYLCAWGQSLENHFQTRPLKSVSVFRPGLGKFYLVCECTTLSKWSQHIM